MNDKELLEETPDDSQFWWSPTAAFGEMAKFITGGGLAVSRRTSRHNGSKKCTSKATAKRRAKNKAGKASRKRNRRK